MFPMDEQIGRIPQTVCIRDVDGERNEVNVLIPIFLMLLDKGAHASGVDCTVQYQTAIP